MHITSRSCCLQNLGTNNSTLEWSYMGRKTIEKGCLRRWLRLRRLQVSGHRPHDIRDNPLPCQKKAVILHSHSSEMASLTKVSSRVRDLRAPHLLLSPFEHSSLGAPRKTHRTFIALPSHVRTRAIHKRTWCFLRMLVDK